MDTLRMIDYLTIHALVGAAFTLAAIIMRASGRKNTTAFKVVDKISDIIFWSWLALMFLYVVIL